MQQVRIAHVINYKCSKTGCVLRKFDSVLKPKTIRKIKELLLSKFLYYFALMQIIIYAAYTVTCGDTH